MLCRGRFQQSRPVLVLILDFTLLQNSQIASLAFFTLLPLATASQILGTFEKFPESLSAKSARFFQPIAAFREFRRAGHVPPSPDFRPSALSFDLESQLIGLSSLFLV